MTQAKIHIGRMSSLRICGSRKVFNSSAFGLNTSRCSSLSAAPWVHTILHSSRHWLRSYASWFSLIPLLKDGWYYGQDINKGTIAFGEDVLREAGISQRSPYTLFASDQFEFTPVDRPVQIAFANSVFSHLTLNSIFTALLQLQSVLSPTGVLYATFFALEGGVSG